MHAMEDQVETSTTAEKKYLKKLNLTIPLLSVRRHGSCSNDFESSSINMSRQQGLSRSSVVTSCSERVPFSWEQAPGKPKARSERLCDIICAADAETPRPKPPPGRRRHQRDATGNILIQESYAADSSQDDCFNLTGSSCSLDGRECCCSNFNSNDVVRDRFSDAVDTLSLSEAIDILEKSDRVHELDASKLKMVDEAGNLSPSFMINRFLPDANALAVESFCSRPELVHKDYWMTDVNGKVNSPTRARSKGCTNCTTDDDDDQFLKGNQQPNMKVCGLQNLFSWRLKHRLCCVNKSPVLRPP